MNTHDKELRVLEYLEGELSPDEEKALLDEAATDGELATLLAEYQQQERGLHAYFSARAEAASRAAHPDLRRLPVAVAPARPAAARGRRRLLVALAAAAVLAVMAGIRLYIYPDGNAGEVAILVKSASGRPQALTQKGEMLPLEVNRSLPDTASRVKTPEGSYIELMLGSDRGRVEMSSNSSAEFQRGERATNVTLDRGELLAWPGVAVLTVSTPQLQVTGRDSVFSVVRGLRGSEVSVLRGEVEVTQAGARRRLHPGQSYSSTGVKPLPITQRVAWSEDASGLAASLAAGTTSTGAVQVASAVSEPATAPVSKQTTGTATDAARTASLLTAVGVARTTDYLPDSTVSFIESPNVSSLRVDESGRTLRDVLHETSLRAFISARLENSGVPQARIDEMFAKLEEVVTPEELDLIKNSLGGSLSVAATPHSPILVAEITENSDRVAQIVNEGIEPWLASQNPGADARPRAVVVNNMLLCGVTSEDFAQTLEAAGAMRPTGFATSAFLREVHASAPQSRITAAADILTIRSLAAASDPSFRLRPFFERTGLGNMTSVVAASSFADQADNRAMRISFDGDRRGVMNWLGEPAPLASTQFFSPSAHLISASRIRKPELMLNEVLGWMREDLVTSGDMEGSEEGALIKRLAATLGNEVAFGIDNPVLPVPNVKVVAEVIDPIEFHNSMLALTELISRHRDADHQIVLDSRSYKDRLIVDMQSPGSPVTVSYAIINDYVVFGPGRAFLQNTIDLVEAGQTIDHESAFLEALPGNSGSYVSMLTYVAPARELGDARPIIEGFLRSRGMNVDLEYLSARTSATKPRVFYAIATGNRIDFYMEGVKGDYQMAGMLPLVADLLSGTTSR